MTTSFWLDIWHEEDHLVARFPALRTHCAMGELTVRVVIQGGLRWHLVPRLTQAAQEE